MTTTTHPRLSTCRGCRQDITTAERPFARITVNGVWHSECWTVHTDCSDPFPGKP